MVQNLLMCGPSWETWRIASSNDTALSKYHNSELSSTHDALFKTVAPGTALAIRAYGAGSEDATATITLSGWLGTRKNPNGPPHGLGPGQAIYAAEVQLGTITHAQPLAQWTSGTWREVDVYNWSLNAVSAYLISGGGHATLIVPTLLYTHVMLEITGLGAPQATSLGVLYTPVALVMTK